MACTREVPFGIAESAQRLITGGQILEDYRNLAMNPPCLHLPILCCSSQACSGVILAAALLHIWIS